VSELVGVGVGGAGGASRTYMLNMRSEEEHTVFYSDLARFMNTATLNMYMFLSNTVFTRRTT